MISNVVIVAGCTCRGLTLAKQQTCTYVCFTAHTKYFCRLLSPENSIVQALFTHWNKKITVLFFCFWFVFSYVLFHFVLLLRIYYLFQIYVLIKVLLDGMKTNFSINDYKTRSYSDKISKEPLDKDCMYLRS